MGSSPTQEVTELLAAWSSGDKSAIDKLTPLVYEELRRIAHGQMRRERDDHTLQTTALVNEAYLKLVGQKEVNWESRSQFFGLAAQVMRNILVDHARSHSRRKRGGGAEKLSIEDAPLISVDRAREFVALDEALVQLEIDAPRKAKIVEMKFFGGFSVEEIAGALNISTITVMRDWNFAKAWLFRSMNP
ncbi:MAG TPA: sigma-70 family RNA polymerase sigma factor [Pyrinomonadaceae bacterium]|nr:sigma-70 family RNA polymerase sigma factor [Pyrinomonadaceae bacterium]